MSNSILNIFLNKKMWLALVLATSVSACSDHEEVLAIDRVDEAAKLAIENAPVAEKIEFPVSTVAAAPVVAMPATDEMTDASADAVPTEDLAVDVGAQLYNAQCSACHANGLLNAPKYGDTAAWAPRITQGIDTLTSHSANGYNQMPAQASATVTEVQIRAAVEYMVDAAS
jgi:cytochrome c5